MSKLVLSGKAEVGVEVRGPRPSGSKRSMLTSGVDAGDRFSSNNMKPSLGNASPAGSVSDTDSQS